MIRYIFCVLLASSIGALPLSTRLFTKFRARRNADQIIQSSNVQRGSSQRMTIGDRLSNEQLQFAKEAARQLQTPYNCAQLEQMFENITEVHCFPIADQFKINMGRRLQWLQAEYLCKLIRPDAILSPEDLFGKESDCANCEAICYVSNEAPQHK